MIDFGVLESKKNLLGFSAGVDSTALFFMLLEAGVDFDLAMVDYKVREQSQDEVLYAKQLAQKYQKKLFLHQAPKIKKNFENQARIIRYKFFDEVIKSNGYENLILAHHFNDRLEWFLMQFFKGCGLNTLLGFNEIEERKNYKIVRPLINTSRDEILDFVKKYHFFEDLSNQDTKFLRNKIRKAYATPMIKENKQGILRSFEYLLQEKNILYPKEDIFSIGHIFYFKKSSLINNLSIIDKLLKRLGYVWSKEQRKEVQKQDFSICLGSNFLIDSNQNYIFVAKIRYPHIILNKDFKNWARKAFVPQKIRKEFFGLLQEKKIILKDLYFNF
ncbi:MULTISPECIES: tRNA lysidine(34) synthetase TilS [unclassified Helicobacter]|uniref:tRNA lysidine(34) synthetase TilS n=1 Tax=unclassified Helicobacter TaxID=2593540 RepID=UPI000CF1A712|nr:MULTISPECIES: tRNA lysidine(34) synthetase TilS [unclassified Helicobacter]